MPCATSIEEAVRIAAQRWPGYEFRITGDEAHGPCPICGGATQDGFIIYADGGTYCRPGEHTGWVDDDRPDELTPEEKRLRRLEAEQARQRRKQRELERRLTVLERMNACKDHLIYHRQMDARDRQYWSEQGIFPATIDAYELGVCYRCPTDREHRPSYTIPVRNGGKLQNIQHRLIDFDGNPVQSDKYRPQMAGLGKTLFNADNLYNGRPRIVIVEGSKKAIVTAQYGFNTVGIFGAAGFKPHWAQRFTPFREVVVALDPDVPEKATQLARLFGDRGRVACLPCKPDDLFSLGGTPSDFESFLRMARKGAH